MSKGIKILLCLLSTLVLLSIILPLSVSLALTIPSVQNRIVRAGSEWATEWLGTKVGFDRIDIRFPNKLTIKGFYVEDYQHNTLIYVGRLVAPVTRVIPKPLYLGFGNVTIDDGEFDLRADDNDSLNIKLIVNKIKSAQTSNAKSEFHLAFKNVTGHRVRYGQYLHLKEFDSPIDYGNMVLDIDSLAIENFHIVGDSINMCIKQLRFKERSGLDMGITSEVLNIYSGKVLLDNAVISTATTRLNMPQIHLVGRSWDVYKQYVDSVEMNITSSHSTVSTSTLAYFTDVFADMNLRLDNLSCSTSSTLAAFRGEITSANLEGASLAADFTSTGLPDIRRAQFNIRLHRLNADSRAINAVLKGVTRKSLPQAVSDMLRREGTLTVRGNFNGTTDRFKSRLGVSMLSGRIDLTAAMRKKGKVYDVDYTLGTNDFSLGRLLANAQMGDVSCEAKASGQLDKNGIRCEVALDVPSIKLWGYCYKQLSATGRIDNRRISSIVRCDDPNLRFMLDADNDFSGETPLYDGRLTLSEANLAGMRINRRDSVSVLSGDIEYEASGSGLDNLYAKLSADNLEYRYNADTISNRSFSLQGHNNQTSKYFNLSSDIVNAEFRSRLSYRDILGYLKDFMDSYLPIINRGDKLAQHTPDSTITADAVSYSMLSVRVGKANAVTEAIAEGLQIAEGTALTFVFNPKGQVFNLTATSDYLEYNNMFASRLSVNAGNKGDSLALYLTAEDMYIKTLYLPNLSVQAGAKNRNVSLSSRFANRDEDYSAMIGLRSRIKRTSTGEQVNIYITPSHITRQNKTWYITSGGISYDTTRIAVRNFVVSSPSKYKTDEIDSLKIWGTASRSNDDTLHVSLSDVDLSPLLSIAKRVGYDIQATANGHVDIISALHNGRLDGRVDIDSMAVGKVRVAPARLTSSWDFKQQRVILKVDNRHSKTNILTGFYSPNDHRFLVNLTADSIDTSLIDPLLSSVLKNTQGKANARLRVTGTLGESKNVDVNGLVAVPHFQTTVGFTNVTYRLNNGVIDFTDNVMRLRQNYALDPDGNRCKINLSVDLNHLKNIKYNVDLLPVNMLVLNTTARENEMFYGTIYASGKANIRGDNMGSTMTATASPTKNSVFYYPLNSTVQASSASFVTFRNSNAPKIDSTDYLLSKKLSYERRRKRMESESAPFRLGLNINLTPDAEFVLVIDPEMGGDIQGRGEGDIAINVDTSSGKFNMYGTCSIVEGVYNFAMRNLFADKKFTITPGGTITWTGAPDDALLSLEAVYKLKASLAPLSVATNENMRGNVPVECLIKLTGELLQPTITFDVKVPNADTETQNLVANAMTTQEMTATQFFCLLAFNSFYSESGNTGQSLNVGAIGSATGFEFLSNQISSWLSNDQYNIILRYIPRNELSGEEFDFGFSKGLIDNRLFIEIEGNYVSDRASTGANQNASNLSGDFFLTWLLDRAGNLKLKGFSQTITRFDENQGLQESGIGLYFKKDFNSFKEIFAKKRKGNRNFADDDDYDIDRGDYDADEDYEDMYDVDTRD